MSPAPSLRKIALRRGVGPVAILGLLIGLPGRRTSAQAAGDEGPRPLIVAHYMPWFVSKEASGVWGWHWTMGRFDPERLDASGRREIASHLYPLIGPYDGADPDVIEYHTLLMRIAGIDGVIADWYGSDDFNDYAMIHRRAGLLFDAARRRGLKFAACYEDRVLKALVEGGKSTPEGAVDRGKAHLKFCEETWFGDPAYLRCEGKPLLLVFGPDYLKAGQWEAIFSGMARPPAFFSLHEPRPPAIGSFAWPPMWASTEGVLSRPALDAYLDRFENQPGQKISGAFPGFHDIYKEAGVQPSHGFLDARNGETLRHTMERAIGSKSAILQIATWNDFGEGTCIEPTRENGYRDLETIQDFRRRAPGSRFAFRADDLRIPIRIHGLRKRLARGSAAMKTLDEAVERAFAGEVGEAVLRIDALEKAGTKPPTR